MALAVRLIQLNLCAERVRELQCVFDMFVLGYCGWWPSKDNNNNNNNNLKGVNLSDFCSIGILHDVSEAVWDLYPITEDGFSEKSCWLCSCHHHLFHHHVFTPSVRKYYITQMLQFLLENKRRRRRRRRCKRRSVRSPEITVRFMCSCVHQWLKLN